MTNPKRYIFVLWSDGFDEVVTAMFVTQLREAGLLVRVVGLLPGQISGARGLALGPDLRLDQALALAAQVQCLIIPSISRWSERFNSDPRLNQLVEQLNANQAIYVMGQTDPSITLQAKKPRFNQATTLIYPQMPDTFHFARQLARQLS
jgi:putative intracellular protease/amidase